ncbi:MULTISPECIES: hypothetical protein [Protofrankia]|uniref:Uncharacterized protein n=1 Tax=Candidatus Protofrankia datiscae TaxID=2716812 RepID=F8B008_9ACTN|nr:MULTISPECIES: hypothetical protein [Protofrankia]AEH11705.1 hypothetical protein FsymDg_4456 [Candidatus Protofrankia datiscae]
MNARTALPAVARTPAAATPAVAGTAAGRGMRASVFAGSSVCLAVAAHTAADGHRPSMTIFLGAFGLITRIAYGLAGRERHAIAVLAGVGLTQIVLHATFAVTAHDAATAHGAGTASDAVLHDGAVMSAVHAVAAGLVAGMLRHAEKGLWSTNVLRSAAARFGMLARRVDRLLRSTHRFAARCGIPLTIGPAATRAPGMPGGCPLAASAPSASMGGCLFVRAGRRRGPPARRTAAGRSHPRVRPQPA